MGACCSQEAPTIEDAKLKEKSFAIDKMLEDDGRKLRTEVKILLLGSGESGKSTIVKQMKIIHQNGYTRDELLLAKMSIFQNVLESAQSIVLAMRKFGLEPAETRNRANCEYIMSYRLENPTRTLLPSGGVSILAPSPQPYPGFTTPTMVSPPQRRSPARRLEELPESSSAEEEELDDDERGDDEADRSYTEGMVASESGTLAGASARNSLGNASSSGTVNGSAVVRSSRRKSSVASGGSLTRRELIAGGMQETQAHSGLSPELVDAMTAVWNDAVVQKDVLDRSSEFYLMDSAEYFFTNMDRIGSANYVPTQMDYLRARIRTTGITETFFRSGHLSVHMFDVGGQRSERKKWIHCFEGVTSIIFCTALSEYDQVLLEEPGQNRMAESLVLFESVINSRWFLRSSIILFLNKTDVFKKKIAKIPLETYFPDYAGGEDVNLAAKFLLWRFHQLNRQRLPFYPHLTQATDTSNIRLVFAAVRETIMQNALRDSGIL